MTLQQRVLDVLTRTSVVDIHTHLFAPEFGDLNLWGVDELLTFHYLVAEVLRAEPTVSPESFFARTKEQQADLIWEALFVRRTPLSEAAIGVIDVLTTYGLDPAAKDLREARAFFASRNAKSHLEEVLALAGVRSLTMTNDPLDREERSLWDSGVAPDERFHAALRIDQILGSAWFEGAEGTRRFLDKWVKRMRCRYVAASFPPSFAYPDESGSVNLLTEAVLPVCHEHGLPFAMMIGARRRVNPRLGLAGDGMGVADLTALERLATDFPDNRFLVTTLARENAHGLCVVARKFANVLPFGCWWFMCNASLVEETTRMRLEMLGSSFVPQHSDARVLDQLIYKWRNARAAISKALACRYEALENARFAVTDERIERDAKLLLAGNAAEWLGLSDERAI